MKKTHKVVMLTTEKASRLAYISLTSLLQYTKNEATLEYKDRPKAGNKPQHLYLISDDEIKKGDWCILLDDTGIPFSHHPQKWDGNGKVNKGCKKIVATTDLDIVFPVNKFPHMPQIPVGFIEAYIKAYNEESPITEVAVEYEKQNTSIVHAIMNIMNNEDSFEYVLKTRSDNTVVIHQSRLYTRDEMEQCFKAGMKLQSTKGPSSTREAPGFDTWINNL